MRYALAALAAAVLAGCASIAYKPFLPVVEWTTPTETVPLQPQPVEPVQTEPVG